MRDLHSLRNTYKNKPMNLALMSNFHHRSLTEGSNSSPLDPQLQALRAIPPRIHTLFVFLFLFLQALKVTMKKHPSCFKVLGEVAEKNNKVGEEPAILYDGNNFLFFLLFSIFVLV